MHIEAGQSLGFFSSKVWRTVGRFWDLQQNVTEERGQNWTQVAWRILWTASDRWGASPSPPIWKGATPLITRHRSWRQSPFAIKKAFKLLTTRAKERH